MSVGRECSMSNFKYMKQTFVSSLQTSPSFLSHIELIFILSFFFPYPLVFSYMASTHLLAFVSSSVKRILFFSGYNAPQC